MIVDVILPKLGMYQGDARLVDWLVADGAQVVPGDPLFVVETDKIESEIEADDAGVVVHERCAGFTGPIGTRIGYVVSTPSEYDELRVRLGR